jgi:hypothetical protein
LGRGAGGTIVAVSMKTRRPRREARVQLEMLCRFDRPIALGSPTVGELLQ